MLIIKIVNSDHISYLGAPLLIEHGQWRPVSRSRLLIDIGGYVEINVPVSSSVAKNQCDALIRSTTRQSVNNRMLKGHLNCMLFLCRSNGTSKLSF